MKDLRLLDIDLSLFDGEGGAPSGDSGQSADSGVATPASKPQVIYGNQEPAPEPQAEVKPTENVDPSSKFEELIKGEFKDPFEKKIQQIIDKRFKQTKELEKKAQAHDQVFDLLQKKYGTDKAEEIYSKLENDVVAELAYLNDMAPDKYKMIMEAEKIKAEQRRAQEQEAVNRQINETVARWNEQAKELQAEYPDFDLHHWLQDDKFLGMLKSNIDVKTAYQIMNIDNLMKQSVKEIEQKTAQSISKKQSRPSEAALKNQPAPIIKSDVSQLSRADREEIARRAARGEKISFGK